MQLVEDGQFYPGCCVLGGGHKDLVDFQRAMPLHNEGARMYVAQQFIADAARLMGWKSPEQVKVMREDLEDLRARVRELQMTEIELAELRRSVRATLDAGATVDQRTGELKPRLARGQKRSEVKV
jgi:hypothetical protein